MRAAAHGAKGRGRVVDGIGKMVSLLGWSISLTGAMIFTLEQTTIPQDAVVPWAAGLVLFPALVTLIISLLPVAKKKSGPDSSRLMGEK